MYANKLDNLHTIDKFLERHKLPNLIQDEIENLTRPKTRDSITKNIPPRTSPGPDGFTGESY